jgi:hypothetical protein
MANRSLSRRKALTLLGGSGIALPFFSASLQAATLREVANADMLAAALHDSPPGTVLSLAPGSYGTLAMQGGGGRAGAPLILAAADPAQPPRFDQMMLRDVAHLVMEGLLFDYVFTPGDALFLQPFEARGTTGLTLRGCVFAGDVARSVSLVDDGFGTGHGLALTDCADLSVAGCTFFDFHRGIVVTRCHDVMVQGNDIHSLRMDGMNFAQVSRVTVAGNHIHDFNRSLDSEDHSDMIQFWTNKTTAPSTDVAIRGNLLNSGRGWFTQSIFMRNEEVDEGRAGAEMFYRNILIEDNFILNAHLHGITVGESKGLTIRRNTIVRNAPSEGALPNPAIWVPIIRVAERSQDVTIRQNIVARIEGGSGLAGWNVGENFFVQDATRLEPNHYSRVFVGGSPDDPESFWPLSGGPLAGIAIGAPPPRKGRAGP